jgi:cytidylate kinase
VARRVADLLGYAYLDSGAMYRALAWKALQRGVPLEAAASPAKLEALASETRIDLEATPNGLRVILDGADVTNEIRRPEVSQASSKVAIIPGVRHLLVAEQQRAGRNGGVVMEGRDIGTVVFPHAELKIFLDASVEVRAERRWRELHEKDASAELSRVIQDVRERDRRDREREVSPLAQAEDAVLVDNSAMNVEETARLIVMLAREKEKK